MALFNLTQHAAPTVVSGAVAGAATSINTSSVDAQGAFGVAFNVAFGAVTVAGGTPLLKVQHSDDNSTWTDITDSQLQAVLTRNIVAGHANKIAELEVAYPVKRYHRVVVDRTGNAGNSIAIVYVEALVHGNRVGGINALAGDAFTTDITMPKAP